jgi:two-component system, NarL family, nitrate/nitrite response regulator NarL
VSLVAIIDPRTIWCAGMAALVIECGCKVLGRWATMNEALPNLIEVPPDIVLVSHSSSRELRAGDLLGLKRRSAIVVVAEPREAITAQDLPGAGADALLSSDASVDSIRQCLSSVAAGHSWLDPALLQSAARRSSFGQDWNCLSARELEVAHLASRGLSNKRIARTLEVSDGTVKIHMHHILSKLHVPGREALAGGLPGAGPQNGGRASPGK